MSIKTEAVTAGPCWTGLWELCCFRLVTIWVTSLGLAGEAGIFAVLFSGVPTKQFSSMEHDRFYVPYVLDKIPEDAFHGQVVKTVAYLRVSTA